MLNTLNDAEKVAQLIREAGGKIVGRTRLQKIACLLELADVGDGFRFSYHHFGPYSEELSGAAEMAELYDMIQKTDKRASWGGTYSVYTVNESGKATSAVRQGIIDATINAGAIVLELAATAAYLAKTDADDPWREVAERKPEKATPELMTQAKDLYRRLLDIAPALPSIA